jgi:predicted RNA-binding protein with PUA domain
MAEERFALVFWIEDEQYSVVERGDIIGEVELNKTMPVSWRTKSKKKGAKSLVKNWFEATILKLSGKS